MNKITRLASDAMPKILNFGVAVGSGVVTAITALISSIYMLAGKGRLVPQLKKLIYAIAPKTSAERFLSVCSRANGYSWALSTVSLLILRSSGCSASS